MSRFNCLGKSRSLMIWVATTSSGWPSVSSVSVNMLKSSQLYSCKGHSAGQRGPTCIHHHPTSGLRGKYTLSITSLNWGESSLSRQEGDVSGTMVDRSRRLDESSRGPNQSTLAFTARAGLLGADVACAGPRAALPCGHTVQGLLRPPHGQC